MTLAHRPAVHSDRDATRSPDLLARLLARGRPLVMGVLNVTPDSFSDGGRFLDPGAAIEQARRMVAEGADILDIGAESTRPYGDAVDVPLEEELARLEPVLPAVVALGVPVSIDTIKPKVAAAALAAGAAIVNDVWGLQRDPEMAPLIAAHAAPVVIMHNRAAADPAIDIMADIMAFLTRSLAIAERAGIARERIVLDLASASARRRSKASTPSPAWASWKSFGLPLCWRLALLPSTRSRPPARSARRRIDRRASAAVAAGAAIIPRHDVAETVQALRVAAAIGAPDDRPCVRHRIALPRLSRRDAARGQSRADLPALTSCSISTVASLAAPTSSRTPATISRRRREPRVLRPALPAE